jgi:hypothetical protein
MFYLRRAHPDRGVGMSKIEAGWITTATVISSAIGGWLAGVMADHSVACAFRS